MLNDMKEKHLPFDDLTYPVKLIFFVFAKC